MNILNIARQFVSDPKMRFFYIKKIGFYNKLNDEEFVRKEFRAYLGYELNLEVPITFNEKIQWLKLNDHDARYTKMVDKYAVKEYVSSIIGDTHIIPTLGVWDRFEDIDFRALPNEFVLKCTHDSGGLVICRDKTAFNKEQARRYIGKCMKRNFYLSGREWPYKNVKRRIIAEKYMEDDSSVYSDSVIPKGLTDYKFYCFDGEPRFLYLSKGLENHTTARISFVTLDWQFADYQRLDYKPFDVLPPKPNHFDQMMNICRALSKGHKFLRVDLYEINGIIYFSEFTFYPVGGYMPFRTYEQDVEMGKFINI